MKCSKAILFHFYNDFAVRFCSENCFCLTISLIQTRISLTSAEHLGSEILNHLPHLMTNVLILFCPREQQYILEDFRRLIERKFRFYI